MSATSSRRSSPRRTRRVRASATSRRESRRRSSSSRSCSASQRASRLNARARSAAPASTRPAPAWSSAGLQACHWPRVSGSPARRSPRVQRDPLDHRHEAERSRACAEIARAVLSDEHRLTGAHERLQARALLVFEALLVQRPVELADELRNLTEIVLEADRQSARVRRGRQPAVVAQLVARPQAEAGAIRVAVDVVGLDGVESLARAEVQPSAHDRPQGLPPHVEPALSRPALERAAERRAREPPRVRAAALIRAGAEIAGHTGPARVQLPHGGRRRVEQVHVVQLRVHRQIELPAQLPLPRGARRRQPQGDDAQPRSRVTVPLRASTIHTPPAPTASAVGNPEIRESRCTSPERGSIRWTIPSRVSSTSMPSRVTASAPGAPPTFSTPCRRPLAASMRVTVPSPRFATHTLPNPTATSCGSRPTGSRRPITRFSRGSTRATVPSPALTIQT